MWYTLVSSRGIAKGMPDRAQVLKMFTLLYHLFAKRSRYFNRTFKHSIKAVSKNICLSKLYNIVTPAL